MDKLQLCVFEIGPSCNRGVEHTACPNAHTDRWKNSVGLRPMTDARIVSTALLMHEAGFTGCIAFHHYNEPLIYWTRIKFITAVIRGLVPHSQFLLWTNGDLFPKDLSEFVGVFQTIIVSNYAGRDLTGLSAVCGDVRSVGPVLDWRLNPPTHTGCEPCYRPYLEMVFDYYGNVRLCCYDWRNEVQIGNIHDTPFSELWERWLSLRGKLASTPMAIDAPPRCLTCGTRYTNMASYVPEVAQRIAKHLEELS